MPTVTILALPLGGWEIVVIIMVLLLLFYARRLPEIARSLGRGITEFRHGLSDKPEQSASPPRLESERDKDQQ